ncbi:MAG: FMN-binding protein [Clostridia bacterium]|nr:FMN-binding protein [Clostridia bacterium]
MAEEIKSEVKEEPPVKKNFFKTTSFKCIIVLLAIVLVCGIILTICNSIFYVSDEERLSRAISKIYGYEIDVTEVEFTDDQSTYGKATVLAAYKDANGDYLVSSKGKGGFAGTVTCWVLVNVEDGAITGVSNVVINTSDGETLLNSIDFLDKYKDTQYTEGYTYTTDNGFVTSGATKSSNAINNAVNGAVSFVNVVCLGGEYTSSTEENLLETGATLSNTLCAQAALFAAANYDKCVASEAIGENFAYTDYIDIANAGTKYSIADGIVTYNIVTLKNAPAGAFTLTVTVGADKTVGSFNIDVNGSTTSYYSSNMYATSNYVGKSAEELYSLCNPGGAE